MIAPSTDVVERQSRQAPLTKEIATRRDAPVAHEALGLQRPWSRPPLTRLRWQVPLLFLISALVPGIILPVSNFWASLWSNAAVTNSFVISTLCGIASLLLFRRLERFPGIASFAQVAPSVVTPFGVAFASVLLTRIEYSGSYLLFSALNCLVLLAVLWSYYRRRSKPVVCLLPGASMATTPRLRVRSLATPSDRIDPNSIVAANLRADLSPAWQRFILNAALAGIPVYDVRTLEESATGKVEIAHLSENNLGSVLPDHTYLKIKRLADILFVLLAGPLVAPLLLIVAAIIKLDSHGPVLFIQRRVGFRGKPFKMIKFRTMRTVEPSDVCAVRAAMTLDGDSRITRLGRFLRRHRLDELPQILNILKGDMSWIGPRPEAVALARHYESQIPFYGYRHMVRPGITGWAQVSQGHVVEVDDIRDKLNYDFYYIKNFSAWLDTLIAVRTVRVLLFGNGAR